MKVLIVPRFIGSFEKVAKLLCQCLQSVGVNCHVLPLNIRLAKFLIIRNRRYIFIGPINDSALFRFMLTSPLKSQNILYGVVEGPISGFSTKLAKAFHIVVPSKYVADELSSIGGVALAIIPHATDVEFFEKIRNSLARDEQTKSEPVTLFSVISNVIRRKGLEHYFQALRIAKPRTRFKVLIKSSSSIPIPSDLREKVEVIPGYLPEPELLKLYLKANVVTVPSLSEGFSLPIIEAFAAGKPVISLDAPPMNELNSRRTGWLVRVKNSLVARDWPTSIRYNIPDIEDFALKIGEAVDNVEARLRKSEEALLIRWRYQSSKVYPRFLEIMERELS